MRLRGIAGILAPCRMANRSEALAESSTEPRGVYWARFRKNGLPVLYAVTSAGDVLRSIAVEPHWDRDEVVAFLWKQLDEKNPLPTLVRDAPTISRPLPTDPRHLAEVYVELDSFAAWRRDRAKKLARGWRPPPIWRDQRSEIGEAEEHER